jgi:L-ascorbate metabolism protein UlaG (beta-lactamase superfamily)
MKIQLLRHATCLISYQGKKVLLDPMLSPAGAMEAIPHVPNPANNPLVQLPANINLSNLLADLDGIMITHTHRDHFDNAAIEILPKEKPLFCQPQDSDKIKTAGFLEIHPVMESLIWSGITIHRTAGRHGTKEIGKNMGPVSGYVLKSTGEPTLYITGDTIGCSEVNQALEKHQPDVIIAFAGAAQFHEGDPITMTASDIVDLAQNAPQAKILVVHMEAWNHCRLTRKVLHTHLGPQTPKEQVMIPANGAELFFK